MTSRTPCLFILIVLLEPPHQYAHHMGLDTDPRIFCSKSVRRRGLLKSHTQQKHFTESSWRGRVKYPASYHRPLSIMGLTHFLLTVFVSSIRTACPKIQPASTVSRAPPLAAITASHLPLILFSID
ncbi:hypothetical protein ACJQWK_06201 [Exserohilum turcicum]